MEHIDPKACSPDRGGHALPRRPAHHPKSQMSNFMIARRDHLLEASFEHYLSRPPYLH